MTKTYSIDIEIPAATDGDREAFTKRLVACPDPKRPGMYKMTLAHSDDGFKHKWSYLYGKKNQSKITDWISKMSPVAS